MSTGHLLCSRSNEVFFIISGNLYNLPGSYLHSPHLSFERTIEAQSVLQSVSGRAGVSVAVGMTSDVECAICDVSYPSLVRLCLQTP